MKITNVKEIHYFNGVMLSEIFPPLPYSIMFSKYSICKCNISELVIDLARVASQVAALRNSLCYPKLESTRYQI